MPESMRSDAFAISFRQGEISLLFGISRGEGHGEDQGLVRAQARFILAPSTAKRFHAALRRTLTEHEAAYGPVSKASDRQTESGAPRRLHPPVFRLRLSTQKAVQLLDLLERLGVGIQFERSFKLLDKTLLANRFLIAVHKQAIGHEPEARVLHICEELGMPEAGQGIFQDQLSEADVVGFGLEEDAKTCLVKAYVEFRRRYTEAMRERRAKEYSYLSHLGIKWDAADPARHVVARYTCFPALTAHDMLERVAAHYGQGEGGQLAAVRAIVEGAAKRVRPDGLLYIEVSEEHTVRASFDINVYGANLKMSGVRDALASVFRHYTIPEEELNELYETMKDGTLGHLAGGLDRRGRDFLTMYFEE